MLWQITENKKQQGLKPEVFKALFGTTEVVP
jgi:hypothetical protein